MFGFLKTLAHYAEMDEEWISELKLGVLKILKTLGRIVNNLEQEFAQKGDLKKQRIVIQLPEMGMEPPNGRM